MAENRLVVFLRAPRLGAVKTRLAAEIGAEAALAVYRFLVARTFDVLSGVANVELRFTPDDAEAEVASWRGETWRLIPQGDGSLGQRLERATAAAFASGLKRVVLIGTDCPELTLRDLEAAFEALVTNDLVIGPASDGGYWLIGLRQPCSAIFTDISWGSSEVLKETLTKARDAGLKYTCLRELGDVDTASDWQRYQTSGQ
ncbi:MAG TPA: TIGR04282 family arsenosugar biosynthesis glycosyltransferase [Verrucomicrobiota bacterium]|nr:hypothetical protein [Verrucomicrobiales bacterium]HRI13689.1 TIGR04282 family arsenosugar biosynthesis glycosyltransferase [Verrucomicrobiota bacterium]